MEHDCNHIKELNQVQAEIIEKHVEKHKFYRKIVDRDQAILDFIKSFGWAFRESFCRGCRDRHECVPFKTMVADKNNTEVK